MSVSPSLPPPQRGRVWGEREGEGRRAVGGDERGGEGRMRREFEGDMGGRGRGGNGRRGGRQERGRGIGGGQFGGGDREGDREHFYQTLLCQNF